MRQAHERQCPLGSRCIWVGVDFLLTFRGSQESKIPVARAFVSRLQDQGTIGIRVIQPRILHRGAGHCGPGPGYFCWKFLCAFLQ